MSIDTGLPPAYLSDYLSEELDGHGFVNWILSSKKATTKWLQNLCEAERQGAIKFARLLNYLGKNDSCPYWLYREIRRMQQQEAQHYVLVKDVLLARNISEIQRPIKVEKVSGMYLSEQRAVMRFRTLLSREKDLDSDIYNIAYKILPDEAYHVVICQELMHKYADVEV